MLQHLVRFGVVALAAAGMAGLVAHAQARSQAGRPQVLPAIEDPQADFAPGVPRASTPGVSPPRVIKQVPPKYTDDAMRARVQGIVVLDALIGEDGSVEASRVRCSLHPSLDVQAQKTLSGWTFHPARLRGFPTRIVVEVHLEFRIHEKGAVELPRSSGKKPCEAGPSKGGGV